ncbi:hypothetical protein B4096_0744 [Heyndrickxia coagulans]|nr:hypothetical protein B4096_0744 [Heyndrickxia coagulans]
MHLSAKKSKNIDTGFISAGSAIWLPLDVQLRGKENEKCRYG